MHKRNKLIITIGAAASLGLASVTWVYANSHGPKFPISIDSAIEKQQQRFAQADQNGDGSVDLEEFEQTSLRGLGHGPRPFGPSARRWRGAEDDEHAERRDAMRSAVQEELFAILDTNGDGNVNAEEFSQASREQRELAMRRAAFKRLDVNQDALLTPDELPDRVARLRNMDTDGDGQVTRAEFRQARHHQPPTVEG